MNRPTKKSTYIELNEIKTVTNSLFIWTSDEETVMLSFFVFNISEFGLYNLKFESRK